jgi:hypothetical protein
MIQIQWTQLKSYSSTINDPNPVGPAEELLFNNDTNPVGPAEELLFNNDPNPVGPAEELLFNN